LVAEHDSSLRATDLLGQVETGMTSLQQRRLSPLFALLSLGAAVAFAAAANSWESVPEIRDRLLLAVRNTTVPILLLHAANDYSTKPGKEMDAELSRLAKPHALRIYPPAGQTAEDGHNFVYIAVPLWETDVFRFLDHYVGH
jgi:pimeloyl-ACP methyl ester carboxylesterase